jgi:two-component system OmpR family sensor kinase
VSLRLRLLVALGASALVALLAADLVTYSSLRSFLYQRVDRSLDDAHLSLERELGGGGAGGNGGVGGDAERPGPPAESRVATVAPGTYVQVRDATDRVLGSTPSHERGGRLLEPALPAHIGGLKTGQGPGEARTYLTVGSKGSGPQFRVRASTLANGNQLVLAVPVDDTTATLHRLLLIEAAVTTAALAAATALGWWLVRVGLRPLRQVEDTAAVIAGGDLDHRVPGDDANTEVGHVARALNIMLARIADAFAERDATVDALRRSEERLRRFVADASHELRTPLAAVAGYAELFERGASERPEDLARVMRGIRTETARMAELVQDLLLLARLDEGRPLAREPVELVSLVAEAVEAARAAGPDWPVEVRADRPVEVVGDAARLRQVVDNLLANVRAHTPRGTRTETRVTADGDRGGAVVQVIDHGPGLGREGAARVFERFYRADASRSRTLGGAGLGLAIVAAITGAHGGTVEASPTPGGGATFTVRLPPVASEGQRASAAPVRPEPVGGR